MSPLLETEVFQKHKINAPSESTSTPSHKPYPDGDDSRHNTVGLWAPGPRLKAGNAWKEEAANT